MAHMRRMVSRALADARSTCCPAADVMLPTLIAEVARLKALASAFGRS